MGRLFPFHIQALRKIAAEKRRGDPPQLSLGDYIAEPDHTPRLQDYQTMPRGLPYYVDDSIRRFRMINMPVYTNGDDQVDLIDFKANGYDFEVTENRNFVHITKAPQTVSVSAQTLREYVRQCIIATRKRKVEGRTLDDLITKK